MNGNTFKVTLMLTGLTLFFVFVGRILGGNTGMVFAFLLAVGMNFFAYWYSDKMVLKMYRAQEVTEAEAPGLYRIVRNLAQRGNLPMPKVYVMHDPSPNAFATGRNPENAAVAATTGILEMLTEDEMEGVMAHELSHIYGRDILIGTIAATFAGAISMMANMAQWAMIFGGRSDDEDSNPIAAIAMMIIAPIAAMLIQMAISRSREYLADQRGAKLSGKPHALASALAKISGVSEQIPMAQATPSTAHMMIMNPLSGKSMMSLFSTHPPVQERIARLQAMAGNR